MDENYNEKNFDEQEKQNISRRNDTGVVKRLNQFSSGFKAGMFGENKTKERINKRGTNEPRGVNKESGKMNPDENKKQPGDKPGLEKKDGLEKKNNNQKNKQGNAANKAGMKKPGLPGKLGGNPKEAAEAAAKLKKIKLTLLKLKIAGIVAGILLVVFIIAYLFTVIDNFFSSIVLNFFVPEQKEDDLEGLYTDSKYLRDPETGEMYTWPELIKVLNNDDACEPGFWDRLKSLFGIDDINTPCDLMRYIKKKVETYEKEYMGRENSKTQPNTLDRALILGTIFYGYDSQATYDSYDTPPSKEDDKGDTFTSASDHYETMKNVIKNGKITKKDVDRIIQSTIFEDVYPSFTWVIREEERWQNGKKVKVKVGYCDISIVENYLYSRDKWEMFIRWNDEYDVKSGDDNMGSVRDKPFSVPGYIKIKDKKRLDKKIKLNEENILTLVGTGYTYDTSMNNAWNSTSEKCNGTIPEEVLLQEVDILDDSVPNAHDYFILREFDKIVDTTIYFQKIEDVYTQNKDVFQSRNIKYTIDGPHVYKTYVEFEYKHGFGYINFPSFKQADEDSNLPKFEYDDAISPKKVEEIVLEVKDRKGEINNTLLLKDLDSSQYGENGYWDDDGNYIPGIDPDDSNDNIISNANCAKFLATDNLDDLTVNLTNCDGNEQESTDFKNYVIGTLYGEIDYTTNKDYALTQMIAIINFALAKNLNYKQSTEIVMRNGDCDQVFSSPFKGSYMNTSNIVCYYQDKDPSKPVNCNNVYQGTAPSSPSGEYINYKGPMSDEIYKKYEEYYEIAKNYLVIKNGEIYLTRYIADKSIYWEKEAASGKNFLQILKETYGEDGADIIECSTGGDSSSGDYDPSYSGKGCLGIVEAAQKEVGNTDYNPATKEYRYSGWFSKNVMSGKEGLAWCAMFVSWVANKTGYTDQITLSAGCPQIEAGFSQRGKLKKVNSGYQPKAGDIVFFDYCSGYDEHGNCISGKDGITDHVAIVKNYDPNTRRVCTIGGNEGNPNGGANIVRDSEKVNLCFYLGNGSEQSYGSIDCKGGPSNDKPKRTDEVN